MILKCVSVFVLEKVHFWGCCESKIFAVVVTRQSYRFLFFQEKGDNVEMMDEIKNDSFEFCDLEFTDCW